MVKAMKLISSHAGVREEATDSKQVLFLLMFISEHVEKRGSVRQHDNLTRATVTASSFID